jgi:hypothetical protein
MKKKLERIWAYLDGEMEPDEKFRFEQELANDPHLLSEYRAQLEIYKSLSKTEVIDLRKQLRNISDELRKGKTKGNHIKPMGYFLAAATLVVLMAILYLIYSLSTDKPDEQQVAAIVEPEDRLSEQLVAADSLVQAKPQLLDSNSLTNNDQEIAYAYLENDLFESLIGIAYRSYLFRVDQPEVGRKFDPRQMINFAWQPSFSDSLTLQIYNNNGKVIDTKRFTGNAFIYENSLSNGIYYFKLISPGDDLFVGKFLVK